MALASLPWQRHGVNYPRALTAPEHRTAGKVLAELSRINLWGKFLPRIGSCLQLLGSVRSDLGGIHIPAVKSPAKVPPGRRVGPGGS